MKTVTIGTVKVTSQKFTATLKSVNNAEAITLAANAAALQAINGRNLNWIGDLLALPTFKLKSGELSAAGKVVKTFVLYHTKGLTIDKSGKATLSAPEKCSIRDDRSDKNGKFNMTYAEFLNRAKADKTPAKKTHSVTSKQCEKSILELLGGIKLIEQKKAEFKFNGSFWDEKDGKKLSQIEMAVKMLDQLEEARDGIIKLFAVEPVVAEEDKPDADKVAQLNQVAPSSRSRSAPKKSTAA